MARLFVALWPSRELARASAAIRDAWAWSASARPTTDAHLHVTLRFIGEVTNARVEAFAETLGVEADGFSLRLDRVSLWTNGIAALEPSIVTPPLTRLRAKLDACLANVHIANETRAYRPHVTLARDARGSTAPPRIDAIDWRVDGYALVESRGGRYSIVRRYPLD
jgi:2'-5' RNA ligase